MKANLIDVELMRSLLEYDPEVGGSCLKWKTPRCGIKVGTMAGYKHANGYWIISIGRKNYYAHRLIWAVVKGEDPPCQVDHIKGKEAGNFIDNLRLAYKGQLDNQQNASLRKDNTSGYPGVSFRADITKWVAQIGIDGKRKHVGFFDTPEEAYAAYLEVKTKLHTFNPVPR